MTKRALKFNNIRVNKKKFHVSKEPIDLMPLKTDKIVVSNKFNQIMALDILLVTKKVILLNHYVLFYLK